VSPPIRASSNTIASMIEISRDHSCNVKRWCGLTPEIG